VSAPSRIRVQRWEGELQLLLPQGRTRLYLRQLSTEPYAYAVTVHRLKPNGRIGRREPPVRFAGKPLRRLLEYLVATSGLTPQRWQYCTGLPPADQIQEE
jgi:hypothetical protein